MILPSGSSKKFPVSYKLFFTKCLLWCFVLIAPTPAQAGFFSTVFNTAVPAASAANIESNEKNSQTMQLLQVAVNSNPSPNLSTPDVALVSGGTAFLAESGPVGTLADVEDASSTAISIYTVRSGDSLEKIAKMFNVSVNTVLWANNLNSGGVIKEGQTLLILPISGIRYTIKSGDTLKSIVIKYKADINEVADYNNIAITTPLAVGTIIILPDAEPSIPQAPKLPSNAAKNPTEKLHDAGGPSYPGYYIRPIVGGVRTQGLHGYNAVDLAAQIGTPVHAAAAGTVIAATYNSGYNHGYGNYVVISHPNGTQTLYAHMSQTIVTVGQSVDQGDTVGKIGMTGKTTGPHVHFEIRGARNPF